MSQGQASCVSRSQYPQDDDTSPGSSVQSSSTASRQTRGNILPTNVNPPPVQSRGTAATPPTHQLQGTLDKIIASVNAIQAEQRRQSDTLDEFMQSSFSIEKSGYKVNMHCCATSKAYRISFTGIIAPGNRYTMQHTKQAART